MPWDNRSMNNAVGIKCSASPGVAGELSDVEVSDAQSTGLSPVKTQ